MQPNHVADAFTYRGYLVVFSFKLKKLHFSVSTTEAKSPAEAVSAALRSIKSGYSGLRNARLKLGVLLRPPVVVLDNEANRALHGITDEGYPESTYEHDGDWYNAPGTGACRVCSTPVPEGRYCPRHKQEKVAA